MANPKGINDYMIQESVAPYCSAVVATTNEQDTCSFAWKKS